MRERVGDREGDEAACLEGGQLVAGVAGGAGGGGGGGGGGTRAPLPGAHHLAPHLLPHLPQSLHTWHTHQEKQSLYCGQHGSNRWKDGGFRDCLPQHTIFCVCFVIKSLRLPDPW